MNTAEIFRRIIARTGATATEVLVAELNIAVSDLWEQTDPLGCLFEVYVRTNDPTVVTMPPYVYQIKGVRHSRGQQVTLYTPRPYYDDGKGRQTFLEFRELGKSPLIQTLSGAGRLRARVLKENGAPFKVTFRGPDLAANDTLDTLSFSATDVEKTSIRAFTDVIDIAKNVITDTDIQIYDVQDELVGILLANQQRADNLVIRITDPAVQVTNYTNTVFGVLYKCRPPVFTDDEQFTVDDVVGKTLTDLVSAELLSRSKDQGDLGRARAYEKRADARLDTMVMREGEGKQQPIKLTTSPYTHLYHGIL